MSVLRQDENRITGFVESSSSANGKENTAAESIDVLKIKDRERRVADNELGHKADLREGLLRRKTIGNAEADSGVIERPLHGQGAFTSCLRVENRRKSDGHSLLKGMLTPEFTNTRRKSTSELEGKPDDSDDRGTKNTRSALHHTASSVTWWNEQNQGNMRNYKIAASHRTNEDSIYTNYSVEETLTFPAMHGANFDAREEVQEHRLSSPSWTHRKETQGNRLNYGESVTVNSRRLVHFDRNFSSHKIILPNPGQGNLSWKKSSDQELTIRGRSFSDSEVHLEDSLQMTAEQKEKLEHLKCQILEKNLKRKGGRHVNEVKQNTAFRESRFPILTEKSLKRCSRCHEKANVAGSLSAFNADQKISLIDVSTKVNPATSESAIQNQDLDIDTADETARRKYDPSSNTEQSNSEFIIAPTSSTLAYFENTQEALKRKSNGSDIPTPPNSEEGDFESISVISGRFRSRSEPGDVGTRKVSTVQQLQNRARSENVGLKTKVQSFVKKPLPTLPPCSLRVTKQALNRGTSKGHFKAGAHANITFEKPIERKEGVINIHTCPNMNLFSDKSWMYQDESRKKHRYIRGPATPVPPVEFVFRKDEPDSP